MNRYLKYLSYLSAILFVTGILLIYHNRAKIVVVKITDTYGVTKDIKVPFVSVDEIKGVCTYDIDLQNSLLFSGEIQIIPNDCIIKITVNDFVVPDFLYSNDSCDYINGFYLNISRYLNKNNNKIILAVSNNKSKYGLYIKDTTRYEVYLIYLAIICIFPLLIIKYRRRINLKQIWLWIRNYKKQVLFSISLSGFFLLIIYSVILFNTKIELVKRDGTKTAVTFPFRHDQQEGDTITYKITEFNYIFFPSLIRVIPNGCVQSFFINQKDASSLMAQNGLSDWYSNADLNLEQFLKSGKNEILITKSDPAKADCGGFMINKNNSCIILYFFFFLLFISPIVYHIYNKILYGKYVVLLFIVAAFIWLMYAFWLPYHVYSYDVKGHIQYINYIYEKNHIPITSGGWSFYHPALYYISSAELLHIANIFGINSEIELNELLQIFSVLLFVIYSYFSIKSLDFIFRRNLEKLKSKINQHLLPFVFITLIGTFLFWPSNVIHSIRIGNDIMLYAFYAVAFYFIIKWYYVNDFKNLIASLIFITLAIWSKTHAILLFGIIGLLLIYHFIIDTDRKNNSRQYLMKFLLVLGFAVFSIYFAFNEKIKNIENNLGSRMILENENKLPDKYKLQNNISNYFSFSAVKFVEMPYTKTVDDAGGRQSFWYYLFKTSLFGEFSFEKPVMKTYAALASFMFLLILIMIIAGIIISFFNFKTHAPFIISAFVLIGSMLLFRIISPYACTADFRYIFPAVTIFTYFIGIAALYLLKKNKWVFISVMLIPLSFIVFSFLFQVSFVL